MAIVKFLKTKKNNKEYIGVLRWMGFDARPASIPCRCSYIFLLKFSGIFNFQKPHLCHCKPPNFQNILTLICSFTFWHLQSVNIRFSMDSKSATKVYNIVKYSFCSKTCSLIVAATLKLFHNKRMSDLGPSSAGPCILGQLRQSSS